MGEHRNSNPARKPEGNPARKRLSLRFPAGLHPEHPRGSVGDVFPAAPYDASLPRWCFDARRRRSRGSCTPSSTTTRWWGWLGKRETLMYPYPFDALGGGGGGGPCENPPTPTPDQHTLPAQPAERTRGGCTDWSSTYTEFSHAPREGVGGITDSNRYRFTVAV